nr:MAG TPA: hypothetical protein [Caudoviricetes sp.]
MEVYRAVKQSGGLVEQRVAMERRSGVKQNYEKAR